MTRSVMDSIIEEIVIGEEDDAVIRFRTDIAMEVTLL